jgi:hypothetical protein
MLLHGILS